MPKGSNFILICSFIFVFLTACNKHPVEEASHSNALHLAFFEAIRTLDPAYSTNEDEQFLVQQLFDGLVDLDDSGKIIPAIAKSWELSDDALTYTFHLRQDIYFMDDSLFLNNKGRKMRASDVVNSFHRVATGPILSPGRWIFKNLDRNASNYYKGIKDINDSTLCIYLTKPDNSFLKQLSLTYCSVLPIEIADYYGANFGLHPIGSGAYQIKFWNSKNRLLLAPNPNHYALASNQKSSIPESVVINLALTKTEAFNQFLNGKIDWFFEVDERFKNEIISKDGSLVKKFENRFSLYRPSQEAIAQLIFCNQSNDKSGGSQKELLLRRAIDKAIDRDKLQVNLFNNLGTVATQAIIPSYMLGKDRTRNGNLNSAKEQAEQLLERGGFTNSQQRISLILGTTKDMQEDAKFIQQNLADLSIEVKLVTSEAEVLTEMMRQGDLDLVLNKLSSTYSDPAELIEKIVATNSCLNGDDNANVNAFHAARVMLNESNQLLEYQKIEKELLNKAYIIPLYFSRASWLINHTYSLPKAYAKPTIQLKMIRRNSRETKPKA